MSEQTTGAGTHSRAVDGPVVLDVEAGSGDVTVRAVETGTCTVEVSGAGSAADRTTVQWHSGGVTVRVPRSGGFLGRDTTVHVTVTVPPGSRAELSTRSGAVRTSGTLAEVRASSGSGDVLLEQVSGFARVTTGSGRIELGDVGQAQLRSGSGDVRLARVDGALEVGTGSGDVHAGDVGGTVQVHTGSGDVRLRSTAADVTVSTASGDVTLARAVRGEVQLKTASGDVAVTVPAGTDVLLDCTSVSGRLRSDLQPTAGPQGDAEQLHLRARTVSGDVDVRRG